MPGIRLLSLLSMLLQQRQAVFVFVQKVTLIQRLSISLLKAKKSPSLITLRMLIGLRLM